MVTSPNPTDLWLLAFISASTAPTCIKSKLRHLFLMYSTLSRLLRLITGNTGVPLCPPIFTLPARYSPFYHTPSIQMLPSIFYGLKSYCYHSRELVPKLPGYSISVGISQPLQVEILSLVLFLFLRCCFYAPLASSQVITKLS